VSRRVTELRRSPAERRIKVVLADDDGTFVESLRTMVDGQPRLTVVGVAGDGLEAIELVEELAPEAVVIDLHMPRLDGVSAVARMRQDHPSLCLIALTADGAPELHRAVEEAGADAVLMKGHSFDALVDQIVSAQEQVASAR
jgi:two-component system, chemotaxis family, protein-glutamate methylesterase/glutaminase